MGVDDRPERYDLIIIGTGSGNAIPDFLDDWKIAVVERDVFGGTCINRGCVPSKMFVLPADVALLLADHVDRLPDVFDLLQQRRVANLQEVATLAFVRDALLPQLLSGKIHTPELEKLVEQAV